MIIINDKVIGHRVQAARLQKKLSQADLAALLDVSVSYVSRIQSTFETATRQYKDLQNNPYLEGWLFQTCLYRLTTALRTYRRRMKKQLSLDEDS